MKTFELHRIEDATGISGTGIIAQGVVFDDGTCALRWLTTSRSTSIYDDLKTLDRIHGHNGKTKIVYTGAPFERGMADAAQDRCENVPFASVGGLDRRAALVAPDYITPEERPAYIRGYELNALAMYGADWRTCAFGWSPAVEINKPT